MYYVVGLVTGLSGVGPWVQISEVDGGKGGLVWHNNDNILSPCLSMEEIQETITHLRSLLKQCQGQLFVLIGSFHFICIHNT